MAEAVEVADAEPRSGGRPDRGLDPIAQLLGRLDVVGENKDLFGQKRPGEGLAGVVLCRLRR